MRTPITISLSPNTTLRDVLEAWRVLLWPILWHNPHSLHTASRHLSKYLDGRFAILTSSGRQALHDVLRAFKIGKGDEVILQAFTCIAVPEAILWTGARPVYTDIDPKTYNLDLQQVRQKITPRTKAIIVQHTFGIPGPLDELQQIAREHNIPLIEDCAHALGGEYHGKKLGTFGDAAVLSFGRDKIISSVFGGAIVTPHRDIMQFVLQEGSRRKLPPARWVIQQLLHPILFQWIVPNYFRVSLGKALLVLAQKMKLLSKAVEQEERWGKRPRHIHFAYSPALAHLLLTQLEQLESFTAHRRTIAAAYQKALPRTRLRLPSPSPESKPAWLRFPLQVDDARGMRRAAQEQGMLLGDWYNAPLIPGDYSLPAFHYERGSCPLAEEAARHVINLPTYPRLSMKQANRVIDFIKSHGNAENGRSA